MQEEKNNRCVSRELEDQDGVSIHVTSEGHHRLQSVHRSDIEWERVFQVYYIHGVEKD